MKGLPILLGVGALALIAYSYSEVERRAVNQLTARTLRIRAGRLRFEGNRLIVPLIVSNPNSIDLVIRSVVGEAWLNDNKIANVEQFGEVVVKGNAKTTIDLNMRLMALQIIDTILDMMNEKLNVEVGFTGTVNVDNKPYPVRLTYDVL